jgi:hypothetical protein
VPSNHIFLKHKCNIQCVVDVDETQGKYTCTDSDHGGDDDDDGGGGD